MFAVFALVLMGVVLVLPLGLWVALYRTRNRLTLLEQGLTDQTEALARLSIQVGQLKTGAAGARRRQGCRPQRVKRPLRFVQ